MTFVRCHPKPSQRTLTTTYLVTGCSYKVDSRDDDKYRQLHHLQLSLESHAFVIVIYPQVPPRAHVGVKCFTQTKVHYRLGRLLACPQKSSPEVLCQDLTIEVMSFRMKQRKVFSFYVGIDIHYTSTWPYFALYFSQHGKQ